MASSGSGQSVSSPVHTCISSRRCGAAKQGEPQQALQLPGRVVVPPADAMRKPLCELDQRTGHVGEADTRRAGPLHGRIQHAHRKRERRDGRTGPEQRHRQHDRHRERHGGGMIAAGQHGDDRADRGACHEQCDQPDNHTRTREVAMPQRKGEHGRIAAHERNEQVVQPGEAADIGGTRQKRHATGNGERRHVGPVRHGLACGHTGHRNVSDARWSVPARSARRCARSAQRAACTG